jgi:hypothetical protein
MFEDSRPLTEEEWKIIYCRNGKNEPYPKENKVFWSSEKKKNEPSLEELNELKKMIEEKKDDTKHDPYSYAPKNIDQKLTKDKNDIIIESQPRLEKSKIKPTGGIILTQRGSFSIQDIDELQNKYEELQNKYEELQKTNEVFKKWFKNELFTPEEKQKLKNLIK